MSYWDGTSYRILDDASVLSISGDETSDSVSGTFSLSLTGSDSGNLFESGTYLPYTIGMWGDVVNGSIAWNGVELADVIVTDADGNIPDPDTYLLQSANGSLALASFENPPAAVPVPGAAWLFSFGFAGIAGLRRRK